jgi:hypothetical protein
MVSDESELGLTATDLLLTSIKPLIGGTDRIRFLVRANGERPVDIKQISADLDSVHELSETCWNLPPVPFDPKVSSWPGSGNTLFSAGNKELNRVYKEIAEKLGLLYGDAAGAESDSGAREGSGSERRGWLQRIFR